MNIEDNNNEQCCFSEIKEGEVFLVKGCYNYCYYLKMEKTVCSGFSAGHINAVNLLTGAPACFGFKDLVINKNAKVVIE